MRFFGENIILLNIKKYDIYDKIWYLNSYLFFIYEKPLL